MYAQRMEWVAATVILTVLFAASPAPAPTAVDLLAQGVAASAT